MYRSILLTGKKVLAQSSLAPSSTVSRLSLNHTQRFISSSSLRLNDKKKDQQQQPSSILTDDLLDKIGVEVNEKPQAAEAAKDKEGSSDSEPQAEAGKEGGAQPRKRRNVQSSTDIKRERYANLFYLGFLFAGIGSAGYLAREWDDNSEDDLKIKEDIPNGYALDSMWKRFNARFNSIFTYFQEPPFPDLLPDSPPEPYKRPLTLVLTLEDLLIHSEWSSQNGWKTAKRPGVDYFLGYLSQYYEIVLFSSNYMMYSERIVEKLDPLRAYISYQLYKEHCLYKDGAHIKDLSKLNRDLSKTFIIDNDENAIKLQPENAIKLEKWDGKPDDYLIRMIPFLEYLATQQVKDVRPILASFKDQTKIPEEFEQRVATLRADFDRDQAKKSGSFLNSILGLPSAKAKFPLDLIHDEGVRNFTHFQKLIKEEEEKMKQQANMPKETFKLKDLVEGNLPSQEEMMKRQLEKQAEFEKQQQQQQQQKA